MSKVSPIPKGFHSVTPYLVINGAAKAIDYYKKVFGATEVFRMDGPDGKVGHAELQIVIRASCWPTKIPIWAKVM